MGAAKGRPRTAVALRAQPGCARPHEDPSCWRSCQRTARAWASVLSCRFDRVQRATATVPGTAAAEKILPRLVDSLGEVCWSAIRSPPRSTVYAMRPLLLPRVLTSMPDLGFRTAARILLEVGDGSSFATSVLLAACAGLGPLAHRSGISRGQHRQGCNEYLKRALFLAAFVSLAHPPSRASTTANEPKTNTTTPPSSAPPAAGSTSCSPCPTTRRPTKPNTANTLSPLDPAHLDHSPGESAEWQRIRVVLLGPRPRSPKLLVAAAAFPIFVALP